MSFRVHLTAFLIGIGFALGLGISGMTLPPKVIGFLDITGARGAWDPTLAFVMIGAIAMYTLLYRIAVQRTRPLFAGALSIPTRTELDARLIGGAALFGVGWGLSGFCPGPALTSIASGNGIVFAFVAAMVVGMLLYQAIDVRALDRGPARSRPDGPRRA